MNDLALKLSADPANLAKLLYASSAWWGVATADDRHRIEAVVCRGVRAGLYPADGPTATQITEEHEDTLFNLILHRKQHVLHGLLPAENDHDYKLRPRPHNPALPFFYDGPSSFYI